MSTQLRVNAVELATSGGPVRYDFTGPLTVLAGPVGTGKSSLFELIKHAVGGKALFSPVVSEHVSTVVVEITAGSQRLRLTRPIHDGDGRVTVIDLATREDLGEFPIEASADTDLATISDLMMSSLDLPTNARATSESRRSTSKPSKITFNDIWSYIYVEQPEIDRSIAHHNDTYREPKRKAVFQLLFGLTDAELLTLKAQLQQTERRLAEAEAEEATVMRFLADAGTESRADTLRKQEDTVQELDQARTALQQLREETDPADARTDVLRDLLIATKERADAARRELADLTRSQEDRRRLAAGIRQDLARLVRVRDASHRLANIEFVVCPRCSQSIRDRDVTSDACRLCLQQEPPSPDSDHPDSDHLLSALPRDSYEVAQLTAQEDEIKELLAAGDQQLALMQNRLSEIDEHADQLTRAVNERTNELVSPRLQSFADASSTVGKTEERLRALEETLRLWDRAGDVSSHANVLREESNGIRKRVKTRELALQERQDLLATMSSDYEETLVRFGVPGVRRAEIDKKSYLPIVDGTRFDRISTGGIRTALVVAYWVTLLATALRDPAIQMPALVIIDSPRKSIGEGEALAANLYRQLDVLAETYRDRVQIIVADNGLPTQYSRRWQELQFDYEHPVINSVPHPGPARVVTLDQMIKEREDRE